MNNESIKLLAKAGIAVFLVMAFVHLSIDTARADEFEPIEQCWQRPTERESGAALPLEEIVEYQIWYDESGDGVDWKLNWTVPNTVGCVTLTPQTGGEICFNGFTVAIDDTDPTKTLMSKVSNMTCHTPVAIMPGDPPKAPTFLDIVLAKLKELIASYERSR